MVIMNFLCLSCQRNMTLEDIPHICVNSDFFKHKVRGKDGKSIDIILELTCENCSSLFTRSQYKINQTKQAGAKQFFCSRSCTDKGRDKTKLFKGDRTDEEIKRQRSKSTKKSWSKEGTRFHTREKEIEYCCHSCNSIFYRVPRKDTKYNFCSPQCAADAKKKRIEKLCIGCNKIFLIEPHKNNIRKYCTLECFYINTYDERVERSLNTGSSFYKRPIYKGVKFRSGWEAEVAKRLDEADILWEYEKYRFNVNNGKKIIKPNKQRLPKHTIYIPDFYLPEFNIYLEVKGWWRKENLEKVLKFRSHGYKLTIIMEKDLYNKGKGVEDVGFAAQSQ